MKKILLSPWFKHAIAVVVVAVAILFVFGTKSYQPRPFLMHLLITSMCTAIYWSGNMLAVHWAREMYPHHEQTMKRWLVQAKLALLSIFISFWIVQWLMLVLFNVHCDNYWEEFKIPLVVSIIVGALNESMYLFQRLKNSISEAERLKRENIQSQLDTLKNQVNPHFLFNSLNTLASLIEESPQTAVAYVQELSQVYRYILQSKEHELISLREELLFIKAYLFLLEMRFGEKIKTNINIAENYLSNKIPPLTLQILIENAIKHNVVSEAKPLQIDIYVEGTDRLVVKNKFQQKSSAPDSNKVGLKNIANRYKLIASRNIEVLQNALHFIVVLPLLVVEE